MSLSIRDNCVTISVGCHVTCQYCHECHECHEMTPTVSLLIITLCPRLHHVTNRSKPFKTSLQSSDDNLCNDAWLLALLIGENEVISWFMNWMKSSWMLVESTKFSCSRQALDLLRIILSNKCIHNTCSLSIHNIRYMKLYFEFVRRMILLNWQTKKLRV